MDSLQLHIETFQCDVESGNSGLRWEKWVNRLENYFTAVGVTAKKRKLALLLHLAGERVYEIYDTVKNENDEYENVVDKLNSYFKPKRNTLLEISQFRALAQHQSEKLNEFLVRLRTKAQFCEFYDADKEIIIQIMEHGNSTSLRKKILELGDSITIDKVLQMGQTLEMVEQQMKNNEFKENRICAIKSSSRCYNCGLSWPHETTCKAIGKTCRKCGKQDHFERCCKLNKTISNYKSNSSSSKNTINALYNGENSNDDSDSFYSPF